MFQWRRQSCPRKCTAGPNAVSLEQRVESAADAPRACRQVCVIRVQVTPMFGNVAAFVNGNMFMGVFGADIGVKLSEAD